MLGQRAYSRSVSFGVALLAAHAMVLAPVLSHAAATSGGASVEVVASPSALGALSIFEIGIPTPASGTAVINVAPDNTVQQDTGLETAAGQDDAGLTRMQPALFSISGIPDQTFSISVPLPGSASSDQGQIDFVAFEHNAGTTPTIGADGTAVFSVGAKVKISDAGGDPQTADNANKDAPKADAAMPKVNPFGVQAVSNGFLNILVSYN